ncbi:patched domain-containing protein 3-like [Oppia nitens]|uniref:patched domain-containing protein 3-like n=1 Tax=Oppia nitens TaxID=1686743 RepID=UPI0023DB27BD|nr:patched domain-containing protein 3-like [Oppia nitens]
MSCRCIDTALSISFEKLGRLIGQYPGYFVIVPILLAALLATGLQRLHYEDDPEYLFSPSDGRSKTERAIIDDYFPMNYSSNFNLGRITHKGRFGRIIVVAKDDSNILRRQIWDEIMQLDQSIRNMSIEWDDTQWTYDDLCAKHEFKCWHNDILDFDNRITEIEEKKFFLKYPIWINHNIYKAYFFPAYMGGVKEDANNLVESAKAIHLMYFLDTTIKKGDIRGHLWEQAFMKHIANTKFKSISVARFVSTTLQTELEANTHSLVPFFSITIIIMLIFSVGTCMMADWVLSKPWLGLLGCVSAGFAVAAAFGLCVYCGIEMIGINLAAPFLMLGVGMDDAFVLLAAWRRTNPLMTVSERLGHTYSEAAVSITITSVTNFISFMIGTITPFPSVRIFCIYTAVAVLFTYIYHITFFGGCMAFFGHAERRNLHGLLCIPVMPKSLAEGKGYFFRMLCTGGKNPADPNNPKDNKEHIMMIFFRDVLANALNRTPIKLLVIFVFFIYLSIGIYGCTMVKEGLDRRKLSRDDSYSVQFYDYEDRYFREYPYRIQVVVNETLNYADPEVQKKIESMLEKFEESPFVADKILTESWLRAYQTFLNQEDSFLFLQALNISDQLDFNRGLRDIFLHFPLTEAFRNDIVFNDDGSEIIATRYIIQTKNIMDANMEKEMLIGLRHIADSFPTPVTIFHQYFIFFDQFVLVRSISIQTISVAAAVMMVISLIFIPSPSCAIWVAFSIISIEIGVIGYMTLWNVNLDSISMINLIMCIGFSVDFSAHISYAYISANEIDPKEKVRSALYSLGLPIFQGSVSTVLGIIALAFAPSYVFVTFFKTVFLVMLFGATHGVLLLPVLLSITDLCCSSSSQSAKYKSSNLGDQNNPPFFVGDKHFDGKTIMQNGAPIFIPRPTFTELAADQKVPYRRSDEDCATTSKSSASSDGSVVAEKDLGLGTSAEECSEGSWKGSKSQTNNVVTKQSDINHMTDNNISTNAYANMLRDWSQVSAKQYSNNGHTNDGYISDSTDFYGHYSSKNKQNQSKGMTTGQHRISVYHQIADATHTDRNVWERQSAPSAPSTSKNKKTDKNKDKSENSYLVEVDATHRHREKDRDDQRHRDRERHRILNNNIEVMSSRIDRNIANRYNGFRPQ